MEPHSENRLTIETAREVGRQRLDKVLNFVAPILAPDVLKEIAKNAAQDKIDQARERMTALKERIENRAAEVRDRFVEKVTDTYGRFETRFNGAKDKTVAVAKEWGRRTAVVGLTPVAAGEAVWAEVYKIPAGFREAIADAKDKKIEAYKAKIAEMRKSRDDHREKAANRRDRAASMTGVRSTLAGLRTTG